MRILIVSQIFYPTPFRINDIVEALTSSGHEVKVITGLPDYGLSNIPKDYRFGRRRREKALGAEIVRVSTTARRTGVFWRALNYFSFAFTGWFHAAFRRTDDFDVILSYETSPIFQVIPAIKLKKRSHKKLVLYCLDLWPVSLKAWKVKESSFIYKAVKRMSSRIYQAADIVPVSSPAFKDYLVQVCGVDPERIVFLPQHGEDEFAALDGAVIPNKTYDFVYAGNIGSVQRVDIIIRAAAKMKSQHPFLVHIVGSGSELEAVKDLADELDVRDKVIFYGRKSAEEIKQYYHLADCFLLSLDSESAISMTLPGKLQGYMGAGKPVAASASGAVAELIKETQCGLVAAPGDADGLAAIMDSLTEDPEGGRRMGAKGSSYYAAHFTKTVIMDKIVTILG